MRGESIGQAAAGTRATQDDPRAPADGRNGSNGSDDLLSVLAAVDDWVFVVGANGRILRASASAGGRLGLDPIEGVAFATLWAEAQREPLAAALTSLRDGARAERILLDVQSAPGVRIELRLTTGTFRGARAVFGIGRELGQIPGDVSFRRATTALSNSEQKYRALLSSSMFAIAINDERGRFVEINSAVERIVGWSAAEMIGKDPNELGLIPAHPQQAAIEVRDRRGPPRFELMEFKRRDGALRTAMHSTTRVELDSAPLAFTISFDITDYLRAQQALREQDRRFRALFDNLKDGMFFAAAEGRFYEVNQAACQQLGYTREELLQLTVAQVSAKPDFDFDEVERRFEGLSNMTYETEHRRKDGTLIPIELTVTRIEHGGESAIVGIARDLTARKRIQNELRDARDRLQATLQALPDLVFEFDSDGVVRDYFSSRRDLLTVPPEKFLGKQLREITSLDIATTLMVAIHEAIEKGLSAGTQYRVRSGRWFELTAARRSDTGLDQKPRVIAIARDITDRKLHEQELESKNDELMRFTYTVSHDLKSPLVTIKSFLGYLVADLAANALDKVSSDVVYIQNAANRMDQLLDDLLELSRIGRKLNPPERWSLRGLCNEACELVAGRIKDYGAEIILPERDVFLWGDHVRLLELLQNLFDNALKFSQSVRPVRVFVETTQCDAEWVVSVRDLGIGIDPLHQHKLFGLFEKLHAGEGTGIGLALVKRIVEVHAGRVWLQSDGEGHGTTVSFTLPNTEAEAVP